MKKIFAFVLAVALVLGNFSVNTYAQAPDGNELNNNYYEDTGAADTEAPVSSVGNEEKTTDEEVTVPGETETDPVNPEEPVVPAVPELSLTRQPEDISCWIGDTADFYVEANQADAVYRWYYTKDGGENWIKCSYDGYKTNHLTMTVQSAHYTYKFKCLVSSSNGESIFSQEVAVREKAAEITRQPGTVASSLYSKATLSTEVKGNKLSYRWYWSSDGGNTWEKCYKYSLTDANGNKSTAIYEGYQSASLSFTSSSNHYRYIYKCVITDRTGQVIETEPASIISPEIVIISQPADNYKYIGEKTAFTVQANGDIKRYYWYISKDNGANWSRCDYSGYRSNTLNFIVQSYQYGYQFKCMLVNYSDEEFFTEPCTLFAKNPEIASQPETTGAPEGKEISFSFGINGNKLTYRWYFSADNGNTWNKCLTYTDTDADGKRVSRTYGGYSTETLSLVACNTNYNRLFRCVVTDRDGNTYTSDAVSVYDTTLKIISQPEDCCSLLNENATFTVEVNNSDGAKYYWYISKDNGNTWSKCSYDGYKTNTLSFKTLSYHYGYMFYCTVTDRDGYHVDSEPVTLSEPETEITKQPESLSAKSGQTVSFDTVAVGNKLTYRWYYSTNGGEDWIKCTTYTYKDADGNRVTAEYTGYATGTLSFVKTESHDSYLFMCKITDRLGREICSDTVSVAEEKPKTKELVLSDEAISGHALNGYDRVLTWDSAKENAVSKKTDSIAVLTVTPDISLNSNNIYLLHFYAWNEDEFCKLGVKINGKQYSANVYTYSQKTEYLLTVTGLTSIESLVLNFQSGNQSTYVAGLEIIDITGVNLSTVPTGVFTIDEAYEHTVLELNDSIGDAAIDLISDGEYLYSVRQGELIIYSTSDKSNPEKVGFLDGLGNTRELAFAKNNSVLVVSSRENGVYFVDISDKTNPQIISNISDQGLATGVCVAGNYVFISARRFGVEVYNISDISNPVFSQLIYGEGEEFYDCTYDNGYLYVSSWAERKIHIYDVADISNITLASEILLNGMGGGATVKNGILYVATGYQGRDDFSKVTSAGYGMGNGMDIFDVTNPAAPVYLSSVKIDGRYFYSGFDHWRVNVSGNYAYMTNIFGGLTIVDVSNPKNPVKLENIKVNVPLNSKYAKKIVGDKYVVPYDRTTESYAIFASAIAVDGGLYFTTYLGTLMSERESSGDSQAIGLYYMDNSIFSYEDSSDSSVTLEEGTQSNEKEYSVSSADVSIVLDNSISNIWDIVEFNGYYYCATGTNRLLVLDKDYNVVNIMATLGSTRSLAFYNDYCFVAESNAGLRVYKAGAGKLSYCTTVVNPAYDATFTDVRKLGEHYMLAQAGWCKYALIDVSNPDNPTVVQISNVGSMYDRSMLSYTDDENVQCLFGKTSFVWFTAGEDGCKVSTYSNNRYAEQNGIAYSNGKAIMINQNGYIYFDPYNIEQDDFNSKSPILISGLKLRGMPYLYGDYMIVVNTYGQKITVLNISDIDHPTLVGDFSVPGNPDKVLIGDNGEVLVSMRHGGTLRMTFE